MIKIIHTADLHLCSPLSSHADKQEALRKELIASFNKIIDLAISEKADAVFISGDLFDDEAVLPDTENMLKKQFAKAKETLFFITPGNHDPYHKGSVYSGEFPENVYVFKDADYERVDIGRLSLSVFGRNYGIEKQGLSGMPALSDENINVLLYHGCLDSGDKCPLSRADILKSGFDYIALGHIHAFSGIKAEGRTGYAYPGCIQGRGFDECGDKGIIIGNIDKNYADLHFYKTCGMRFAETVIDISDAETGNDIAEMIKEKIENGSISRVTLKGRLKKDILSAPSLLPYVKDFGVSEIKDETSLDIPYETLAKERNLTGLFVKNILSSAEDEEIKQEALKIGFAALSGEKGGKI